MFKNRALRVDFVKKDKQNTAESDSDTDFADKATIVGVVIEDAIKKTALAVCAYVVLDAARKVAIEIASKK